MFSFMIYLGISLTFLTSLIILYNIIITFKGNNEVTGFLDNNLSNFS